jgi:hypothetical protein
MNCFEAERYLSAYMESELPALGMKQVGQHLAQCPQCAALLDAMHLTVDLCRTCHEPEMDPLLPDRILARTSGRPEPVSFYERLKRFALQPVLTPRFAVGAGLTALFFALTVNLMLPRMSMALSSMSPAQVYTAMDRGVQRLYGQGLKAYDKKNEWQAQISYFKNRVINRLQYMIEKFDVPAESGEEPFVPEGQKKDPLEEKRSSLRLMPA